MLKHLNKLFLVFLLLITCFSCKKNEEYKVKDYLIDLAYTSGIDTSGEDYFNSLVNYQVIEKDDETILENDLEFNYLNKTLTRLIDEDESYLKENHWVNKNIKDDEIILKEEATKLINKAVEIINNQTFENEFNFDTKQEIKDLDDYSFNNNYLETDEILDIGEYVYLENDEEYKEVIAYIDNKYILSDLTFDDLYNNFEIQGSDEIDLNEAEVIPANEEIETSYINNKFELLSTKRHSFSKDGFDINYSIKSSGIDVRIYKQQTNKPTIFFDINLSNIKPTYKWNYNDGKLDEAYFKVNYNLTTEIGASIGKYDRYQLETKDKDASSFLHFVKTSFRYKDDEVEATIPICTIKTPIPNVPTATFNIDVVAKIYVTGKVEIAFYSNGVVGFEIKDGEFRIIHDVDSDTDFIVGASARAVAGLNFNLESTKYRLMDVEVDAGVRAAVSSTLHLYDSDGNKTEENLDIPYCILDTLAKDNNDVRVCGDVTLNWVLDVQLNTAKSILNKYGLTYRHSILNKKNQIFGNLTHIENWQFVKYCTRKSRTTTKTSSTTTINSNKITLKKYSMVINIGTSSEIPISSLPSGYSKEDLIYTTNDNNIVTVSDGIVKAISIGSTSIDIKTSDDKYTASINILVSTG